MNTVRLLGAPVIFGVLIFVFFYFDDRPAKVFRISVALGLYALFILLPTYLNYKSRHEDDISKRAADYIKRRFSKRKPAPVKDLVASTGLSEGMCSRAVWLIETMTKFADIAPELLRADDMVGDLWTLHRHEVTGQDREKWNKAKLGDNLIIDAAYHDAFLELMDILVPPEKDWDDIWNMLPESRSPVKGDYDGGMWDNAIWIDTLMHMTFREMLLFMYDGVWPERLK